MFLKFIDRSWEFPSRSCKLNTLSCIKFFAYKYHWSIIVTLHLCIMFRMPTSIIELVMSYVHMPTSLIMLVMLYTWRSSYTYYTLDMARIRRSYGIGSRCRRLALAPLRRSGVVSYNVGEVLRLYRYHCLLCTPRIAEVGGGWWQPRPSIVILHVRVHHRAVGRATPADWSGTGARYTYRIMMDLYNEIVYNFR